MAELTNAVKNIDGKLRFLEFLGEETEEIIEKNERKSITRQIKAYESKLEEIEELKLNIQELKIQAEEEPQEVRNWRKCISEKQKQFEPLLERLQTAIRGFEENDKKNKQQEKEQEYEKEISLEKMKLQQRFEMEKQLIATRGQTKMEVFHSLILEYCPKRIGYKHDAFTTRHQLAYIDYNHHSGRSQMKTKGGELVYMRKWGKRTKNWHVVPVAEPKKSPSKNTVEKTYG
eukprot:gene1873-2116_t